VPVSPSRESEVASISSSHLSLLSLDLPAVAPIARREVTNAGLASRIEVLAGDLFVDALPPADVIVMGNILHDWNEEGKQKRTEILPLTGPTSAAIASK
jgi:hypothetical protein